MNAPVEPTPSKADPKAAPSPEDIELKSSENEDEHPDSVASAESSAPSAKSDEQEGSTPQSNITVLERDGKTYTIIGTAHVSSESVAEVERTIEALKPDTVCVELCQERWNTINDENRWKKLDIFKVIKEGKMLFLLANLAISAYQRRLGAELGVKPGAELVAAAKKGESVGAEIELVDRNIQITLKRTWAQVGFFKKLMLLWAILDSLVSRKNEDEELDIEALKEKANLSQMMAEFAEAMPEVHSALIDERDQYLMSKIEEAPGQNIVAVVGAGHVQGMTSYFGKKIEREKLEVLPKKRKVWGLLKWIIPAIILGAFYYGYTQASANTFEEMLYAWILPNAIFAGVLTAAAGGKLISIASAFVASPITSLNPLLGAGMVVGLIEAWARKPTVEDAEKINDDVQSFRGVYRNAFTRVLLVGVAATLGSALGAWVGLSWVLTLVAS